jgi:L-alanine-DL-glutamate epimerase-like enolase superfamily enzyme
MTDARIKDVRSWTCRVPLSRPIVMGEIRFEYREYVVVEIVTQDGVRGIGYGMTRNSPVQAVIDRTLRPMLIGSEATMTEEVWERLYYRNLPMGQRGIFMRALSVVDIALWDIKAKTAGMPLWKLLGGFRERVPAMVAGGYVGPNVTAADLEREVADYVRQGYRTVKIAAGDLASDTARLQAARAGAGGARLAYDAHWAWRSAADVLPTIRSWDRFDLAWIEDPFPSEMVDAVARLRAGCQIPLALGEDGTGRWTFLDILRRGHADYLRIDATVMGGISEAMRVCALASAYGIPVSPHIFSEVHVHLGAAFPGVLCVEMTEPRYEVDLMYRLLTHRIELRDGAIDAPQEPGLGVDLDRAAVEKFAIGPDQAKRT